MKDKKINRPVVLVAPMDWGLGHATRCIPIITNLLALNCRVIIAASGNGGLLLKKEFPELLCINIRGYNIRYSPKRWQLPFVLLGQVPKIIYAIYTEHRWLKRAISQYSVNAVISDNRMGLFNRNLLSIYITHQLQIKAGNRFTEKILQKIHYWFINKFNECWVPDANTETNLAGELSHPAVLPKVPVKYLGYLSRFDRSVIKKKYDLAIILSGPEPQRSIFEELILKDIKHCAGKILLVRGVTGSLSLQKRDFPLLDVYDFLVTADLNKAILQSDLIISRCGYSSIMDLVKLQKKAILVPTPGQTEQEYLAEFLSGKGFFYCCSQKNFSLALALKVIADFSFINTPPLQSNLEDVLEPFVHALN